MSAIGWYKPQKDSTESTEEQIQDEEYDDVSLYHVKKSESCPQDSFQGNQ